MSEIIDVEPMYTPAIDRMKLPEGITDSDKYQYRYVSNNPNRLGFMKHIGYEVVTVKDTVDGPAHPVEVGNSILMRTPRQLYERRALQKAARARAMTTAPREKVKNIGSKMDVEVTDQTRERRAPMSAILNEKPSDEEKQEGTITRKQVEGAGLSGTQISDPFAQQ